MIQGIKHNQLVLAEFTKFIETNNIRDCNLLEVGCREDNTFKKYCETRNIKWSGLEHNQMYAFGDVYHGDMNAIPFIDKSFDIILCCHTFEHTKNPIQTLTEFYRVSKKYIFMATPYPCIEQITEGDKDHYFVLEPIQLRKLINIFKPIKQDVFVQKEGIEHEKNYNIISIIEK